MKDRHEVSRIYDQLTSQGRFQECWSAMNTALASFPNDAEVHLLAGLTLLQLERAEEAVAILRRGHGLAPDDLLLEMFLARALYQASHYAEAASACDRLLQADPSNLLVLACRGLARLALSRAEGESDLRLFLIRLARNRRAFQETDPALLQQASAALARLGRPVPVPRHDDAELELLLEQDLWDEVLQSCQGQTGAWQHYYRGRALSGLQRYSQAVEAYTQALELEPGLAIALVHRAYALLYVSTERALAECRQALQLGDPECPLAWEVLGTALRNLEQYPQAIQALEKSRALAGQHCNGRVLQQLGFCQLQAGQYAKARDSLSAAIDQFWGCSPEAFHFRGLAEFELENYQQARLDFEHYLAENPQGPARQDAQHMLRRIARAQSPTQSAPELQSVDSPTLVHLKAAASSANWNALQQFLEPLQGDELAFYLERLCASPEPFQGLDAWIESVPNSPIPRLFRGRLGLAWAWQARSDRPADEVSPEAWQLFHERLHHSRSDLLRANQLAPDEATPFAFLLTVAMGEGQPPDLLRQLFEAALERCPQHRLAWENYLYSQTHRWSRRPAEEAMREAHEYCRRLPEGHRLYSLVPRAAINLVIDKGMSLRAMAGNPGLVHCVVEAYTRGIASPRYQEDLHTLEDRNLFALTLHCCGRHDLARQQFEQLGLRLSAYPWSLYPDPHQQFLEARTYCLEV